MNNFRLKFVWYIWYTYTILELLTWLRININLYFVLLQQYLSLHYNLCI